MEKVIKIINEMEQTGLIGKYCIGGGIATVFYVEPLLTYDLDIFFTPAEEKKGIITLSPIYDYLKKRGYRTYKEHIIIEEIPVQFIPVYNKLVKEAVENAAEIKYKNTNARVLKAEYLIAIMLQTFRPKDKERIVKIMDESKINKKYLKEILGKYKLNEKFEHFMKLYYEK